LITTDDAALAHYARVAPLIAAAFGPIPLVLGMYPDGPGTHAVYRFALSDPPATIPTVAVPRLGKDGSRVMLPYLAATSHGMAWAVHRYRALSFGSWAPCVADPEAARFARVTVAPGTEGGFAAVAVACLALRAGFEAQGLQAVLVLDGVGGAALWFPLDDAPLYAAVRETFGPIVRAVAAAHPRVLTAVPRHADAPELVHASTATNAVDRFSALPYSLRGDAEATMATPVRWETLGRGGVCLTASAFAEAFARDGDDVFAREIARIGSQRLPHRAAAFAFARTAIDDAHGRVLAAVRAILADGRARTMDAICEEAIALGLVPATTIGNYIRNSVTTVIDRERRRGETPEFVILPDGRCRANVPVDPFPSFAAATVPDAETEALVARLARSSVRDVAPEADDGPDIGAPFERDVALAFARLGLRAERRGGEGEPDVVATAALGDGAYTVVVECKTAARDAKATDMVRDTFAAEAGTMRDRVNAEYAVLIGPAFARREQLDAELVVHAVALWEVTDLALLLRAHAVHPIPWPALVPLFAAGREREAIARFVFAHLHGARQRADVAYRAVCEEGLRYQDALVASDPATERASAPLDAAALAVLVNMRLVQAGDLGRIGIEDVRAAIAFGTHPSVATLAVEGEHVVVVARPASPSRSVGANQATIASEVFPYVS
jgi:DNA primase